MKKRITIFIFFDVLLYFILFLNNSISKQLIEIASKEFNNKYIFLSMAIDSAMYIVIGFIYSTMISQIDKKKIKDKSRIYEFIIIGINALFISTMYMWTMLEISFVPNWLISNPMSVNKLGSILFGFELYRLIKFYRASN